MTVTVNGTEVWLDPAELPEFTYSMYSLSEPDKINGTRSTTFKLPATNAVKTALGGWGPDEVPPYSGRPVIRIADGGAIIFEGECVVASRSEDEYELVVLGGNSGWVDAAKKTQLNELDLGETQVLTKSYVISRWSDTTAADAYPLIDYGSFAGRAATYDVPFAKIRPAVRVHRILRKFFNDNGYTVEAKGSFSALWEKIIIPNTTGRIQVAETYLTGNTMVARTTAGTVLTVSSGGVNQVIPAGFVLSDPGSNYTATYRYTAPYSMRIKASVRGTLSADFVNSVAPRWGQVQLYNVTANTNTVGRFNLPTTSAPFTDFDFAAETFELDVAQGDVLEMRILLGGSGNDALTSATLQDAGVTFIPTNIEYQANIAIQIGPTLPRLKVADLIKALVNIQNLVVFTDYGEHRVELWRMDDWLKGTSQGVDWSDRMDHTEPPKRLQADIPSRVEFRLMEDDQDVKAQEFREQNTLGIGDADRDIEGGWAQPYEVEVKFAGTVVAQTFGGLVIPTIWNNRADYQEDDYEAEPRLLITDGLAPGAWTFSGDAAGTRSEYPLTYMAGNSGSMGFGEVDGVIGSADTWWYNRLRRMGEGVTLEGGIRVWRHEQGEQNLSKPVWIHWGYGGGWYYVVKLSGVRPYGDDVALAELMPV